MSEPQIEEQEQLKEESQIKETFQGFDFDDEGFESDLKEKIKTKLPLVVIAVFAIAVILLYLGFTKQQKIANERTEDFDVRLSQQVASKSEETKKSLEKSFLEREKYPLEKFVAPVFFGSFSFEYPKNWYVSASGGLVSENELALTLVVMPEPVILGLDDTASFRMMLYNGNIKEVSSKFTEDDYFKEGEKIIIKDTTLLGRPSKLYEGESKQGKRILFYLLEYRENTAFIGVDDIALKGNFDQILKSLKLPF